VSYDLRLRAYNPGTDTPLGLLPEALSWQASIVHNDDGALNLKYSEIAENGAIAARGLDAGLDVALEVNWGDDPDGWVEPDNARFLMVGDDYDRTDPALARDLNLPSWSWLLNKICDLNLAELKGSKSKYAGMRVFWSTSDVGDVVKRLLDEHDARPGPAVPVLRDSWTSTTDSAGEVWAKQLGKDVDGRAFPAGQPLRDRLATFAKNELCDWRTRGRGLRIYNPNSGFVDRSATVHLRYGSELSDAPSKTSQADRVARLLVRGDGKHKVTETDPAVPEHYGRWEAMLDCAGVTDEDDLEDAGQAELADRNRIKGQYTRTLTMSDEEGCFLPFRDYQVGDWVTAPGASADEVLRVMQITITRDEQGGLSGNVVLGDRFTSADLALAGRVSAITDGTSGVSGNGATPKVLIDTRQPAAPTGLTLDQSLYLDVWGHHQGRLSASWDEVTTATDGTQLDVQGYELWGQPQTTPASTWRRVTQATGVSVVTEPFEVGSTWLFAVQAVGVTTTETGLQSAQVEISFGVDSDSPNTPSTPTVYPYLGTLVVGWDGQDSAGDGMPPDFALCRVEISTDGVSWSIKDRFLGAGTVSLSGLSYGVEHFARLVALDLSGNASGPSLVASGTPESAGQILTGELDAGETVRVGPAAGNHVELKYNGFFAYALTAAGVVPVIKLGTGDSDVFTLTDGDGNRLASILGTGAASFQALDTEVLMVAGDELDDILAALPQGLIGRAAKTTDSASIGSTETAYMEFRAVLPKGRQIRFELPSFYAVASASGCITHYNVRVAYDGTAVSTTSDLFASTRAYHATTYQTKVEPIAIEFDTADQVADLREVRFLLTAYRASGSGTFVIKSQVEATTPVQMLLYDSGLPVGNAGVDNTVIRRVSTWNPSSVLLNGAVPIGAGDHLGWGSSGAQWAQALFLDTAVLGETDKSIPSALAGATIEKVEAILYLDPFEDNAWIMGAIRANDLVAADTTVPSGTAVEFEKNTTSRWKVTVDITSIFAGTARGLWIGYPVSDPGGCWTDAATPLQLRITYKR